MSPTSSAVQQLLDLRRRQIEEQLMSATGGRSLCAISKSAGSVPAAKYFEGRLAVVRELRGASRSGVDSVETAKSVHASWTESLARAADRAAGPDWLAYYAGGVDELAELVDVLATLE